MTDEATTNVLVTITNPKANQILIPSQQLIFQYTVNGASSNGTSRPNPAPNYPSSLDVYFKWTQNSQNIQLKAASGLATDVVAGGSSKLYNHRWKLPNCRFFRRYMPSEWSYSLVFDPQYPDPAANNMSKPVHTPLVPLGPKQSQITIPISILFNATAMADSHHKGC
ncbi:RNA methyltransferase tRNA(m5U54)methyltransferase [Mucor velutinosus]|uniref:RNA methyltransferase tRNA(M5U54)methyltransferase n=1 Tax=Mucor velutinosus TaxID=708070 RepID=A0AAN7DMH6_9FUNG|nr:RNA methyltransferase tRNA(m5U54)methyltransferase [Mucor velutinosus]